jgi:arabinofuranosyltransferase
MKRYAATLGVCAVAFGVVAAELAAWTCDDAFISIRYARNLVAGDGLVFNLGERVEGYTNPAWTLLIALGLALGIDPETWAVQLGVLAYAVALSLLVLEHRRRLVTGSGVTLVPVAAIVGATHVDWAIHATSGLETSLVTTVVLAGYLALSRDLERTSARGWPAAIWLAVAALLRPDAGLFAVAGIAPYLARARRPTLARYVATLFVCVGPAILARWSYYGTLVPNTYHAKSAGTPWWDQGLAYLGLYLEQYAALFIALPLALVVAWKRRREDRPLAHAVGAMALAVVLYATAVVRVGGDFMFARLFVPLTPLLAVLLERGLAGAWPGRTLVHGLVTAAIVGAMHVAPRPVDADRWPRGIADEWAVYDPETIAETKRDAAALARVIDGVPVRIGFLGGMARVIDGARVPWAVDAETGLTDAGIARKVLERRGRPGHEKRATVDELLERRVHFVLGHGAANVLRLGEELPLVPVRIGTLEGFAIHWDPQVFEHLRAQGLAIADFPRELDRVIAGLPELEDARALAAYRRTQRFYFDWVDDPGRRAPFVARFPDAFD